jgi:hypothetical protein
MRHSVAILVLLCQFAFPVRGFCKQTKSDAGRATATVVRVTPNPDDPDDRIVLIEVEVEGFGSTFFVPDCKTSQGGTHEFCLARLLRSDGKKWHIAKPVYGVVMGIETSAPWTPIEIVQSHPTRFRFAYSTAIFGLRAGEPLRIAFDSWVSPHSIRDWKKRKVQVTSTFNNPISQ